MLAFHAPPDAVTNPVIKNGKIPGSKSFPPALRPAKAKNGAHFLQIRGNRDGAGDHVEQDVPLRPQQQQHDRTNSQTAARANQHQQE